MKSIIPLFGKEQGSAIRRVSKALILVSFSFVLIFSSCSNVFESTVSDTDEVEYNRAKDKAEKKKEKEKENQKKENPASQENVKIQFSGRLKLNGTGPAEFVQEPEPVESTASGRSARPVIPDN